MSTHRDYRLVDLPGYLEWSRLKLKSGESEAFIAHLDATKVWLSSEEVTQLEDSFFEDLLDDLRVAIEKHNSESFTE